MNKIDLEKAIEFLLRKASHEDFNAFLLENGLDKEENARLKKKNCTWCRGTGRYHPTGNQLTSQDGSISCDHEP